VKLDFFQPYGSPSSKPINLNRLHGNLLCFQLAHRSLTIYFISPLPRIPSIKNRHKLAEGKKLKRSPVMDRHGIGQDLWKLERLVSTQTRFEVFLSKTENCVLLF